MCCGEGLLLQQEASTKKNIPRRNFAHEAFRKTFISNDKEDEDCCEHVLFVVFLASPLPLHPLVQTFCLNTIFVTSGLWDGQPWVFPPLLRPLADKVFATNVVLKGQLSNVHILETAYWGAFAHCYVGCWGSCNISCASKKLGEMFSQNKLCFTKGKWGTFFENIIFC